jgi:hypothetical protein
MSFTVIQAGTALQFVDSYGALTTLTVPTNITVKSDRPPRMTARDGKVIIVNSVSVPTTVDSLGVVRPLTPTPPSVAPILSAGDVAGSLTGSYGGVRYTYVIKDAWGAVISESDYSPPSNTVSITSQNLKVTNLQPSIEAISSYRIYRPTNGGTVLFPWLDIDGNTTTEIQDDLADAGLSILAAPALGNPPHLTLIAPWRERLWGVGDIDVESLLFTRPDADYAWPFTYSLAIPTSGRDELGLRALVPRREALGVGRRDIIYQVTGTDIDDFQVIKLAENTGVESNETVAVYRDTAFWLWKDGVYQWDSDGIKNISDPTVSSWFNTNSYFNQNLFKNSFAVFDPSRLKYRLYLAAAGSVVVDRWVEYDLTYKTWWGPHKTAEFSPSSSFIMSDDEDKTRATVGSTSGFIFEEQLTPTDGASTPIELDVDTCYYDGGEGNGDYEKYWGQLSILGKVQTSGTITITAKTGYLDAFMQPPIPYDMTKGRQRLRRIGNGKLMHLNFKHATAGEHVEVYGFQLPYHILGRR